VRYQIFYIIIDVSFCGYSTGVVVNNVERLEKAELWWQCPAGSYPCNASSTGAPCVERHRWCDHVVDCPNEEDEDPEHCCQYCILPSELNHTRMRIVERGIIVIIIILFNKHRRLIKQRSKYVSPEFLIRRSTSTTRVTPINCTNNIPVALLVLHFSLNVLLTFGTVYLLTQIFLHFHVLFDR